MTMGKLESAESFSYTLMDKLGPVREVITQKDDEWESWGLEEIAENLRKFVERNPKEINEDPFQRKEIPIQAENGEVKTSLFGFIQRNVKRRNTCDCVYTVACITTEGATA